MGKDYGLFRVAFEIVTKSPLSGYNATMLITFLICQRLTLAVHMYVGVLTRARSFQTHIRLNCWKKLKCDINFSDLSLHRYKGCQTHVQFLHTYTMLFYSFSTFCSIFDIRWKCSAEQQLREASLLEGGRTFWHLLPH